jgi:hypothetical protein
MSTLENLTDEELLELSQWHESLSVREQDATINSYSTKFAYHVIRLALEAEQILMEHDLDIQQNAEILKSIRRGEWSEEKIRDWFDKKETHLEELYNKSTLRHSPDEDEIKLILMQCLEQHYGSLDNAVRVEVPVQRMIRELQTVIDKYA